MKIALVSGFLNDHLLPICEELNKKCEFQFIATQDLSATTLQYRDEISKGYVLRTYIPTEYDRAISVVLNSDAVIFGGSSQELLKLRKKSGKISFIYTERFLKKGSWRRFIPSLKKVLKEQFINNSDNIYVLCSGSFVSKDLKKIGFNTDKCFKFGYFPKIEEPSIVELIEKKSNDKLKLLFVGRLLKLKRAIDTLKCCKKLKNAGIDFELNIIGDGPERDNLEKYAKKHNLCSVNFWGGQNKATVLKHMQESHLLFVNSNRMEGWAAVINEAMSQACPVIASNTCGATAYLIKNEKNGFIYKVGNVNDLYNKTLTFINSKNKADFYQNAFNTIQNEWSAKTAADRFLKISKSLLTNEDANIYPEGPLSKDQYITR